jgi:hypothetical protein
MENAAEGQCRYEEDVLKQLEERAAERGLTKWLHTNVDEPSR